MKPYTLLPFRFTKFNDTEIFITNEVGEFLFISKDDFTRMVNYQLEIHSETFLNLKSKHIITDSDIAPIITMLATKYRTKKGFLKNFTCLHMVVPTLRCNSNCIYCQVSRKDKDINTNQFDMNKRTAKKIVDVMFKSPSPTIKIEFQGGEPLLNFKIVQYIVKYAEWRNVFAKRNLEFVLCSNLSLMTEKMLTFFKKHHVYISTSLDGPRELHGKNRPLLNANNNSHDLLVDKIQLCRSYLGEHSVSALMTTTKFNIHQLKEVVDEYIARGITTIFFRSLNPYGFAKRDHTTIGYTMDLFIERYLAALDYIIDLNLKGTFFIEYFALLLFSRIFTPFSTGFVDMQSPAGVAISGVIYDYNGNVYLSDEGRMLAAMGDNKFLMGNVHKHSHQELFNGPFIHSVLKMSCLECLPECASCAYQSFCGADPVRNYVEQGDIIGNCHRSDICKRNKAVINHILNLLKNDDGKIADVFWSWTTRRRLIGNSHGESS